MGKELTKDMTKGKPLACIIKFAIPVILTNILQQIYTLSDTAIISRGVGIAGLAALGSVDWLNWLMTGSVSGLTQGYTVIVSQMYGEKNEKGLRKSVAMIIWCSLLGTVVITLAMLGILRPVLHLLNVSQDLYPLAHGYARIIYLGTAVTMLYNVQASILRALGDSKTPLIAILISSAVNIGLDLLFVFPLNFGVEGAAVATVIAQGCSSFFCFCALRRHRLIIPRKDDWNIDVKLIQRVLGLSLPIVLENIVISIGGIYVQSVVDLYGTNFIAGFTTVNKLYGTLNIIATSLGYAVATFVGQNYGAGNSKRIKQGVRLASVMGAVSAILIGIVLYLFDTNIILFVSAADQSVVSGATFYLHQFANFLWVLYLSTVVRYALQGIGRTKVIMVSGIVGFLVRIGVAMFLPGIFGSSSLYFDEAAAWVLESLVLFAAYMLWSIRIGQRELRQSI